MVHVAIVMFMVYKSKDPIKELFGPAPWINNYDQWFFMNSQGVFGFINQHRVQLVLKYTHSDNPASPQTEWLPLDFKCLPGRVSRRPCLMSPYHYRLDWETWIRVTASGEHLWEQRAPASAYHDQLPEFLQSLVIKLLSGDDDAAGLMGVPYRELYQQGKPPSAISVDFASYTFTDKKDTSGSWWHAEPVGPSSKRAYGRMGHTLPNDQVRKSPRERHWVLGLCALGVGAVIERAAINGPGRALAGVAVLGMLAHVFGVVLASDYEDAFLFARRYMPGCDRIPACLQMGLHAQQRCCYEYVQHCAAAYGLLVLFWMMGHCRHRRNYPRRAQSLGCLDLLVCFIFPVAAYLSRSALH